VFASNDKLLMTASVALKHCHALITFRDLVIYFVQQGIVMFFVYLLDASKALDEVERHGLFVKLIN